jgi:hypothetical protein
MSTQYSLIQINAYSLDVLEVFHFQDQDDIHDVTSQLGLATKENQPHKHLPSNLEKLRNRLSTKMSNHKFKLEPEQRPPKISIKRYSTSSKKLDFIVK